MTNILAKYWKTLAIASVSLTSSYIFSHYDNSRQINNRLFSFLTVRAAEYERRNAGMASYKNLSIEQNKEIFDDDDDDDDYDDEAETIVKSVTNIREQRFREFASVEHNGVIYMTPADFLESVITKQPRPRIGRREITDEMVEAILYTTPPKHRGSKRFFRNLENDGLISYSEYLFLWVILTQPHSEFRIAFNMLDMDGNQVIDKDEFLVLGRAMSDKRMSHGKGKKKHAPKLNLTHTLDDYFNFDKTELSDTTLLLHFFGRNGRDTLNYPEFKRFMENFQTEVLEIEFTEFSHGFKTISDLNFAEILLRYTDFSRETKRSILKKVKRNTDEPNAITFEEFKNFFEFLNNLEEFSIAMRFQQLSNKPISQAEFQRAVRISTGFELESHLIALIFRIFDADDDKHLSYDEFMAVMKDRLSRGFQPFDYNEAPRSKFDQFKNCIRDKAKPTIGDQKQWFRLWKNEHFF